MTEQLPAAILAAGHISADLARATGASAKALVPVGGAPMVDRMLGALAAARRVSQVKVVCPPESELLRHVGEGGVAVAGTTFLDSITTALAALGRPERFLILTGDLPLLTAESVDEFCAQALQSGAGIVYPVVGREDCERVFPGGRRTFIRLREGTYTGGNVAVLSRQLIESQGERLLAAFAARKNPFALSALLGGSFVLRFVLGRLSLPEITARAQSLMHTQVHVVVCPHPEIGFDVDRPSHLGAIEDRLARLTAGGA